MRSMRTRNTKRSELWEIEDRMRNLNPVTSTYQKLKKRKEELEKGL